MNDKTKIKILVDVNVLEELIVGKPVAPEEKTDLLMQIARARHAR
jgi:hypothetical protein